MHGTDFALWAFGVTVTRHVCTLGRVRLSAGRAEPPTSRCCPRALGCPSAMPRPAGQSVDVDHTPGPTWPRPLSAGRERLPDEHCAHARHRSTSRLTVAACLVTFRHAMLSQRHVNLPRLRTSRHRAAAARRVAAPASWPSRRAPAVSVGHCPARVFVVLLQPPAPKHGQVAPSCSRHLLCSSTAALCLCRASCRCRRAVLFLGAWAISVQLFASVAKSRRWPTIRTVVSHRGS